MKIQQFQESMLSGSPSSNFTPEPSLVTEDNSQLHKYQSCRTTLTYQPSLPSNARVFNRKTLGNRSVSKLLYESSANQFSSFKVLKRHIMVSLGYQEKLNTMENLIHNCKAYSEQYGYFYITQPMIFFNRKSSRIQCWIHPNRRSNKPLHPIIMSSENKAKFIFYSELKKTLQKLFFTIPQPIGNTYLDLILHVRKLKKSIDERKQKQNFFNTETQITKNFWKQNEKNQRCSKNMTGELKQTKKLSQKNKSLKSSKHILSKLKNGNKDIVRSIILEISQNETLGKRSFLQKGETDDFSLTASFTNPTANQGSISTFLQSLSLPFSASSSNLKQSALKTINKLKKSTDDKLTSQILNDFQQLMMSVDMKKDTQAFSEIMKQLECLLIT